MTDSLVDRLQTVHDRLAGESLPERLVEASCGPNVKHLTHLALDPADAGTTAEQWCAWARGHVPEASSMLLVEAEECLRGGGLWPWQDRAR